MSRKSRMNDVRNAEAKALAEKQRKNRWIMIAVAAAAVVALIIGAIALGSGSSRTPANTTAPTAAPTEVPAIVPEASHWVEIEIAGYGTITAELYSNIAPITVANFVKLANEGFYSGLTFHRIIDGFMIQGGDPNGDGSGGSPESIKGEFNSNGVYNPIKHERGVLSMARTYIPDSASSQFFIMHQNSPWLDGEYAAFGRVLTGIEIVDAICADTPVVDGNGTVLKNNQPVITAVRVIDKPAE